MGGCRAAISAMKRVRGYAWGYHKTSVMGISQNISHTTTLNVSRYGISPANARDETQMSCAIRMHRQMSCAIRMHRKAIDFELHLCLHVSRYVIFPQNVGHKTPTFCLKRRCSLKEGSVKGAVYSLICLFAYLLRIVETCVFEEVFIKWGVYLKEAFIHYLWRVLRI